MNSKAAKYGLGVALLVIWSVLFLRVRDRVNGNNNFTPVAAEQEVNNQNVPDEAYELLSGYDDPFRLNYKKERKIGQNYPVQKKVERNKKPEKKKVSQKLKERKGKKKIVQRPEFIYKGFIIVRGGKRIALVNDGALNYNLSIGEKIDKTTLVKIFPDSVHMQWQDELFTLMKSN